MSDRAAAASPGGTDAPEAAPGPTVAALRARGAHRVDPVRFGFIEALARRSAAHGGQARRLLDDKLAAALAAYAARHAQALAEAAHGISPPERPLQAAQIDQPDQAAPTARQCQPGPLAGLVEHVARQSSLVGPGPARDGPAVAPAGQAAAGAPAELKAVRCFRSTWSRLSVDRQLAQSQASQPAQAGPLHSHRLVLQALQRMRELSPGYLDRFVSYVDTLFWLDEATGGGAPLPAAGRGEGERKRRSPRGKAG